MTPRLLVIGIGNRDRADDAVGPLVCDRLEARRALGVETRDVGGGGAELLHAWNADDDVIIVDAASPAGRPGRVDVIDALEPVSGATRALSSHSIDVSAWIELGRVIDMLPRSLHLIAVEGEDFTFGAALSERVDRAADDVVELITMLGASTSDAAWSGADSAAASG